MTSKLIGAVPAVGKQLCEALGLDASQVKCLDLHMDVGEPLRVTVEIFPKADATAIDEALGEVRHYVVMDEGRENALEVVTISCTEAGCIGCDWIHRRFTTGLGTDR